MGADVDPACFLFFSGYFFPPLRPLGSLPLLSLSFLFLTDIRFARINLPPTTFHLLASQGDTGSGSEQASRLEIQAQLFVSFTLEWDGHDMEYLAKKIRSVTNYKRWGEGVDQEFQGEDRVPNIYPTHTWDLQLLLYVARHTRLFLILHASVRAFAREP